MIQETANPTKPCRCILDQNISTACTWAIWKIGSLGIVDCVVWCMKTMGPAGPDEHFVHIGQCGARTALVTSRKKINSAHCGGFWGFWFRGWKDIEFARLCILSMFLH